MTGQRTPIADGFWSNGLLLQVLSLVRFSFLPLTLTGSEKMASILVVGLVIYSIYS